MANDLELKFLAIGDSGVGKTCLFNRYVEGQYNEKLAPTVGIDIRDKTVPYKSARTNKSFNVRLQLWDTAGQERFRSLTAAFFRDAVGFLLLFDLTNESSFLNARNWISEIQNNTYSENVKIILVGNKCDLESERIITKSRAEDFAKQNQIDYIETSALKNINVQETMNCLLESVIDDFELNHSFSQRRIDAVRLFNEELNRKYLDEDKKTKPKLSYCCLY